MILKKLLIENHGTFSSRSELDIADGVTVLTGQNDVGKSTILRLIEQICIGRGSTEDEVNIDRRHEPNVIWTKDDRVYCVATFVAPDNCGRYFAATHISPGDHVDITILLTRDNHARVTAIRRAGAGIHIDHGGIHKMPIPLVVSDRELVSPIVEANMATTLERNFLGLAFGENFIQKLASLNNRSFDLQIRHATKAINDKLSGVLPKHLGIKFDIRVISRDPLIFSFNIEDRHASYTPITYRGAGIQKLVTLMVSLANINVSEEYILILLDEPENSLHADAQHMLRALLEELSKNPKIQVIYATHSPSMINSVDPSGLRLLKRANVHGKATTIIENRPFAGNFLSVRSSLGITAGDSLLYAPVTIIVEGTTEVRCIPYLLQRLCSEEIEGFENSLHLLSFIHILDGHGTEFEYWCRMAKSQGCKPIIFVDGEYIRRINRRDIQDHHPEVPIIIFDANQEFEDIVPKEIYFAALGNLVSAEITVEKFNEWEALDSKYEKWLFSKRVNRWIEDTFPDAVWDKPTVMKKALELADTAQITIEPFRELVEAISNRLRESGM